MREIKFRGKPIEDVDFDNIGVHISKDDFVYGNLIVDGEQAWIVKGVIESANDYITLEQWIPVRPETVGQFTGLKDKNGEGDILSDGDCSTRVTWNYSEAQFSNGVTTWRELLPYLEIIGNIHDEQHHI